MNTTSIVYHVTTEKALADARAAGAYTCQSLADEGFIHCCFEEQISGVLERYYTDVSGLLLLALSRDKLQSTLREENTVGGTELFPHVYGTINLDAIEDVLAVDESPYRR